MKFSFYKGPIRNVKPESKPFTLDEAMALIRSDKYKDDIEKYRATENKDVKKTLKNLLPYFTFSGVFTSRLAANLKKHSGLIVLDFDDLDDEALLTFTKQLKEIEWITAAWISPSGNGVKVLVKIDPKNHLESFKQLEDFFIGNFSLDVDQSGKDVARACFVSWDPDLYYNAKAKKFELTDKPGEALEMVQEKSVRLSKGTAEVKMHDHKKWAFLERVKHVVSQIVNDKVDITDNDYDNRRDVGFALATLGEEAREYYKQTVQYNEHDEDDDDKFDDALKNGRFKTPNKFFSLARDCGLSTAIPRTIQEAQMEAEVKSMIGDEDNAKAYMQHRIYLDRRTSTYYSLDSKGIPRQVTNFSLRILYHINTGGDEAYRLMQIKNEYGLERVLRINTDDFVSAGSFKKIIARAGNFLWKGQDQDLVNLQDMLQKHEMHTEMVKVLGWNKRWNFYAFSNGLFDTVENRFLAIDDYGIVEKQHKDEKINFFIPALSRVFADLDDKYANEKKFVLKQSTVKLKDWAKQYVKVFGNNGRIGVVFWVAALFSDVVFRSMGKRMPLPFAYGQRGSGKGTMIQSLSHMWGDKQDQIMLGGATTIVGFMRKLAQFSNGFVWLDEYKNSLNPKVIESLKNIYDRIGYERGKKDNTFDTHSTPISSAVFLSGQEMPTAEPALFTRCILMTFSETKFTEAAREEFRKLTRMENEGLSHLTVSMLSKRNDFDSRFQAVYEAQLRTLSVDVNNNDVDERLLSNYAMLLATAEIMETYEMLPFSIGLFRQQCIDLIMNQYFILKGSDDTSKFWQVVEQLVSGYMIKEDEHYKLANGYIYIFIQDVYHHYVKAMNDRREVNILDKPTLENYLKSDTKNFVGRKRMTIGAKYSWVLQFNYKGLDIDLIRGVDREDIARKHKEMNLEYGEELEKRSFSMPDQQAMDFL